MGGFILEIFGSFNDNYHSFSLQENQRKYAEWKNEIKSKETQVSIKG